MSTWLKLSDGFDEHPKVVALSDAAYRLYVAGLCYASRNLTDGHLPAAVVARLVPHADPGELVDAALWVTATSRRDPKVTGGYVIRDYAEHNRTRAEVERDRAAARDRQRRARERKTAKTGGSSRNSHAVTNGPVTRLETETETETDLGALRARAVALLGALADVDGSTFGDLTEPAADRLRALAGQLAAVGATADDVTERAAIYRARHPEWRLTANALVRHWARCAPDPEPQPVDMSDDAMRARNAARAALADAVTGWSIPQPEQDHTT